MTATELRAPGRAVGEVPVLGALVRRGGVDKLVLLYGLLWLIYITTQFRMPWVPIDYNEDAPTSGIRRVFFTIGAALAMRRLLYTRTFGQVVGMHLGGMLLGALLVASISWSTAPELTIKRSLVYVFGYLMLIALVHVPKWPLRTYMTAVVGATGWIAWASIAAHYAFPKECTTLSIRDGLAGLTVHPNVFGPCLQIAWGLGLGLYTLNGWQRAHKLFLMTGLMIALVMTNSVTALVTTAVATSVFVMMTTTSYRSGSMQLLGVGVIALLQFLGADTIKAFFFQLVGRDESMSGRSELWAAIAKEGSQSPFFGGGYGAFWYEGRGRELTQTWNPRQAHNAYLDVFVDIGLIGLVLILLVVHYRLFRAWQSHKGRRGTRQRDAVAAFLSMSLGLCFVSAFGESFLLKLDKYQFFVLMWGVLVFDNYDSNHVSTEFAQLDRDYPERAPTRRPLVRPAAQPPAAAIATHTS